MREIISEISNSFIDEAISSPRMLEDLAAMEKYMSESYDGRTFVEMIQNADDAGANRIKVDYVGNTLIVANDGRNFDKNDIMAICRSGSSNKQRGKNIGYRGVGFKSATTISTEIIIYSAGVYFTFSKTLCAKTLDMSEDKVPTVRIPFLYEEDNLNLEVTSKIEELESDGFNTFFIFVEAQMNKFKEELTGFNSGWLLFLRKINKAEINLPSKSSTCRVIRKNVEGDILVKIVGSKEQWYITEKDGVSLAFKYDEEKGITACNSEDAVFHCYLPTMDKTGFPFKVNADFSTDPSRKHIIMDEISEASMERLSILFVEFIKKITENRDQKKVTCLELLSTHLSLGDLVSKLESKIDSQLRREHWVLKSNGEITTPQNVFYFPKWIEKEEKSVLLAKVSSIGDALYDDDFYSVIEKIGVIIAKYGAKEIPNETLRNMLLNIDYANKLDAKMAAKLFIYTFRGVYADGEKMNEVFIPTVSGYVQLCKIDTSDELMEEFISLIASTLNVKEKSALSDNYVAFKNLSKAKPVLQKLQNSKKISNSTKQMAMAINKWKTPIQNCLAVESLEGRNGKDVSRKCDEYNIESVDARGVSSYIAVKQVQSLGDSFVLSEKEYSAAQRLGDSFKIFVIAMGSEDVSYLYISNPIESLKLDKVVKEWEFVCNTYETSEKTPVSSSGDNNYDQRLLKSILPEYFNSNQRGFLNDFLIHGTMKYEEDLIDMIEKINAIIDFYVGETFLVVKDNEITAEQSKINSFKKIFDKL